MEVIPRQSFAVNVRALDQVGEARRTAVSLAKQIELSDTVSGKVALVATEMATNLVKHAGGGQLVLCILRDGDRRGIEMLSLDHGAGSEHSYEWMRDGYSTAGSPGQGMGAIQRNSHVFDIHSASGVGTAILSRIWEQPPVDDALSGRLGSICLPIEGERECGDGFVLVKSDQRIRLMVSDGLGHGPFAASATELAIAATEKLAHQPILPAMEGIHGSLRATRGAAVAIADIGPDAHQVKFVGVGNISAFVVQFGERRGMVSSSGIVGHDARRLHVYEHVLPAGGSMILHSDGLTARWDLNTSAYRSLLARHPAVIAGVLFRDFSRGRDDATVVVVKASS